MELDTVNIIEYADDQVLGITSYDESTEGNAEAEGRFFGLVKGHDKEATDEEIAGFMDDGYYEQGTYQVFIVHSN